MKILLRRFESYLSQKNAGLFTTFVLFKTPASLVLLFEHHFLFAHVNNTFYFSLLLRSEKKEVGVQTPREAFCVPTKYPSALVVFKNFTWTSKDQIDYKKKGVIKKKHFLSVVSFVVLKQKVFSLSEKTLFRIMNKQYKIV